MERVELARDCDAIQVPSGDKVRMQKGTEVTITQSLGGTFTIQAPTYGGLFRIASKDADALGKDVVDTAAAQADGGNLESMVWETTQDLLRPRDPS